MRHTKEKLQQHLSYNKDTGAFTWIKKRWIVKPGDSAGSSSKNGKVKISFFGQTYLACELAWLFVYNEWPSGPVEHIDGDHGNNAISNLRIKKETTLGYFCKKPTPVVVPEGPKRAFKPRLSSFNLRAKLGVHNALR